DFLLPRKPWPPEEAQEMALPWVSVTVTMVLLKEERIWTWPFSMFFFSRRRRITFLPVLGAAIVYSPSLLLLVGNGLLRTLAGAGVGLAALTADRQPAAVADAPVAADLAETLDVQGHGAAQIALHHVAVVDGLTELGLLSLGQVLHPGVGVDTSLRQDVLGALSANAVDIRKANFDTLIL